MSDNPDHTRRWLINASGAAILSNALPATPALAQAPVAPAPTAQRDGSSRTHNR